MSSPLAEAECVREGAVQGLGRTQVSTLKYCRYRLMLRNE